ncbi:MAG: HNH endonuclease [Solirubrobacteraceae bacterium]|nr:HNH endonuclease [Solirubrobacteraceae bacterium]
MAPPLLDPSDPELAVLIPNRVDREIYRVLYEADGQSLSIQEIRARIDFAAIHKEAAQQHLDRRLRSLDGNFAINRSRQGRLTTYLLFERLAEPRRPAGTISKRTRAWVLRDQRCRQCGRSPAADHVRLHVDHVVPQAWGGSNERNNLQALCSECNEGKRDYFESISDETAAAVLAAATHDEPHRRIGEALKAAFPDGVRDDVLERIACSRQYQADWQKRLRELRTLGWKIPSPQRQREGGRFIVYYALDEMPPPWPSDIAGEIRRRERARRAAD